MDYKKYLIFVFFVSFIPFTHSQKGIELGGWIGSSFYFGDLNTTMRIQKPGLAFGVLGKYNFNSRIAIRTSFNYGHVGADDATSTNNFEYNRNLSFASNIFDCSNVIEFNFFRFEYGSKVYNKTPYIFGGFNIFHFNPTAIMDGKKYNLRDYGTEGQLPGQEYNPLNGGWVLGGGFKWSMGRSTGLFVEFSTRYLFTDYLDDVSTIYPDKETLEGNRGPVAVLLSDRSLVDGIGEAERQRGDAKGKDKYTFVSFGFNKYFGGVVCPEISKPRY